MFAKFFSKAHVRLRLEAGPLAAIIPGYLRHLEERGYKRATIHQYVHAAEHFGQWLARSQPRFASVDASLMEDFISKHLPRCRCRTLRGRSVHTIRAALRQLRELYGPGTQRAPRRPIDAVIDQYDRHLANTCGATAATRHYYVREAGAFLATHFGDGAVDLTQIQPADARVFVTDRAKNLTPASANVVATAIRSFLRFLQLLGIAGRTWVAAVPRAADWRLARIPRVLTDDEVSTFVSAFDRTTPHGRRDFAMALCLLDLGLRAGEVARLKLDDIDWRACTLTLAPGKTRRGACLPMPVRVARALVDYLQRGRPETRERALFVHHRPPRGRPIGPAAVRSAVRLAYLRSGLDRRLTGTHVLRHTAATRLLRAGVSMKEIADLLRHRSLDTSAMYAKVDLVALAGVARPWPEARS
jgi:site-specific recombinase XerD